MRRAVSQLYGLFARTRPRSDPVKVHVLANAFEVLDVVGNEGDAGFTASDGEEHVVAEGAPHPLKVHAFSCPEAGEDITGSLPCGDGRGEDTAALGKRPKDIPFQIPQRLRRGHPGPEFVGDDGAEELKGAKGAVEALNGLLRFRPPEALDE